MKARPGASLLLIVVIVALAALAALFARGRVADTRVKAYQVTMKSDLANLRELQTRHRAAHGRYTTILDSSEFRWSRGVQLVDLRVTADSWSAIVRHSGAPGACTIEVRVTDPREPTCP